MKRTMIKRVVAMFLAMCIVLSGITIPENTLAAQKDKEKQNNNKNAEQVQDSWMQDDSVIFKHLDKENFKNGKHISRYENEEKLNTYVFGNKDGSKTVYYMYENVKYKDKDGKIKDKDISLVKKNKGYGIVQNEVDLFLPENPNDGVTVNYSGYDVTIIPQGGNDKVKAKQCDDAIIYDEYFGKNASLKYTPLLSGVKEDIILKSYVENASYGFIVETNGLYIYNDDIGYYLADETNSTIIYYLGNVEVYDAIGKPELGEMKITVLEEGQRYKLTLSVSDTFLSDPETVYPVTIDPTITISDTVTGADSIIDAPIFEAKKNTNYAKYKYNTVGTTTASYGIGRTVVKLPGLTSSNEYQTIKADQITSVKFYVRDSSGTGKQTINLYPLTNTTWTETTVKWSNVGSHITDDNYSATLSSGKVTGFDITGLVKYWKTGKYSADAGFILINSTETKNKSFCSSEYGTTSYRPYVEMTYESIFSISKSEADVVEGGTITITAATNPSGQAVTWKVEHGSVASIVAYSNTSCVVRGLKAGKTTLTATMTDADGEEVLKKCDIYVHIADGVYYIQNINSNYCLHVTNGSINEGTLVTQAEQYSGSIEIQRLHQMWKVKYLEKGFYKIMPMHNEEMCLYYDTELAVRSTMDYEGLSEESMESQWEIKWDSIGYMLKRKGVDNLALQIENGSTNEGAEIILGENSNNKNCRWQMVKNNDLLTGVLIYDKKNGQLLTSDRYIETAIEQEQSLDDLQIKVVIYTSDFKKYNVTWSIYGEYAEVDFLTGNVKGKLVGKVSVTATSVLLDGPHNCTYTLHIIPIKSGKYYIRNCEFAQYIEASKGAQGKTIHKVNSGEWVYGWWKTIYETYKRWKVVSLENGYYKIISTETGLALSVASDSVLKQGGEIVQEEYVGYPRQQWLVTPTDGGGYILKPRSSVGGVADYVLDMGTNLEAYNPKQSEYIDDANKKDEWYLITIERAMTLGGEINGGENVESISYGWKQCGYDAEYDDDATYTALNEYNMTASVVFIEAHGNQHLISLQDDAWVIDYMVDKTDVDVRIDSMDLSSVKLFMYGSCLTASNLDGTGINLCSETYNAGAESVMGWAETIISNDLFNWRTKFQEKLMAGATIKEAADYANTFDYMDNSAIKAWRIYGNENLVLNLDIAFTNEIGEVMNTYSLTERGSVFEYSDENINRVLEETYPTFVDAEHIITKTYTNENESNYVVDWRYTYRGFLTNCGYTIIVNNGKIAGIYEHDADNIDEIVASHGEEEMFVSESAMEEAHLLSQNEVSQLYPDSMIIEQNGEKVYNISEKKYYYRVKTTYQIATGEYGAIIKDFEL